MCTSFWGHLYLITLHACALMVGWKIKITKPNPQYKPHSDYIVSLLCEITSEPKPNWTKWWHVTANLW